MLRNGNTVTVSKPGQFRASRKRWPAARSMAGRQATSFFVVGRNVIFMAASIAGFACA
jgi:hypothetical protein